MTAISSPPLPLSTYRTMVGMAPDLIVIVDRAGRPKFVNRAPDADDAVIASNIAAALGERQAELSAVLEGERVELELDADDVDGCARSYHARLMRLQQSPGEPTVLAFVDDITSRKQAESELRQTTDALEQSRRQVIQAQKMESIGRLAGGVAHDFNNLLTSIISFSRFVMDDLAPGDPRRADLVEVLRAADSASRLTSQLLAFSRRRQVEPVVVDLNEALNNIDRVLRRTVEEKVELVVLPCEAARVPVLIDPGQLDQVIMNLAVNARDAMPDGGTLTVRLEVRTVKRHAELEPGRYAEMRVADTGAGMTPEVASQVFEPFFSTKGEKGTGLGLSTVYGIIKQANGSVEVISERGKGTEFVVLLPLVSEAERDAGKSLAPPAAGQRRLSGMALVVEDQNAILQTIVRSLTAVGLNVLHAHSAEEALALVEDLEPELDLLVTDVMLPGLSGLRLTERLRERDADLRVVLCSGYIGGQDDVAVPKDPRTTFLPKPFSGAQLVSSASSLLNRAAE